MTSSAVSTWRRSAPTACSIARSGGRTSRSARPTRRSRSRRNCLALRRKMSAANSRMAFSSSKARKGPRLRKRIGSSANATMAGSSGASRQHNVPILAALGLLDANNPLRLVDMLDLQPDHFAGTQAAPIAKTECHAGLEARGNGQHATRLVRAHHLRNLLGLADVIDLGGKIQPSQRHAEQEPHSSHDAVAIADAYARLGKMQLEPADILHSRRLG